MFNPQIITFCSPYYKLGEMKLLGISQQTKELSVQRDKEACKDYDRNDSPAKCYIEQILRPIFDNETEHISQCAKKGKLNAYIKSCRFKLKYNTLVFQS